MTQVIGTAAPPVRAAAGAITTTIACVLPVFLVGGLAVQLKEDLGFSPAGLGLAVAVYFGVSALASVPAGGLVERLGAAAAARAGIVLSAASMVAIALLARSLTTLIVLLGVGAAANALGQLASNAALSRHIPAGRQGLSFGLKQSGIPFSSLLAGLAVPAVALTLGWRWAFGIAAVAAAAALPFVPSTDGSRRRGPASRDADRATAALIVIGIAATLASAAAGALATFLVDSAVQRGMAEAAAGLALTLGSAICVMARVFGGWQADRRPHRQLVVIAAALAVGAFGVALLAVPGLPALMTGVLLGFGLGWVWPGLMNFAVVRQHAHAPAAATSITQTGVYTGASLGPLTFGAVATRFDYPTMWTMAAAAMLAAAAFMLLGNSLLHRHAARAAAPTHPG